MFPMKVKHAIVLGVVILLVATPIIFFSIKGHTASTFYDNNELSISTTCLDSLYYDDHLYFAYSKSANVEFRVQKLTGEILIQETIETNNPINIQLYVNGSVVYALWESPEGIFFSNANQTHFYGNGISPRIFENTNELYISYLVNNNLFCHKFSQPNSLWLIDSGVTKFSITGSETITYITYTKNNIIYYRMCNYQLWDKSVQFIQGILPTIVPAELNLIYLYYFAGNSLQVGYGAIDVTHTKPLLSGEITSINAYDHDGVGLVTFVSSGEIFLQEITNDGLTDPTKIVKGYSPKLHFYDEYIIMIYRDGFSYYSIIMKESDKTYHDFYPITLDSLSETEYNTGASVEDWYNDYNSYYEYLWSQNDWFADSGPMKDWILEHPFWTSIIMYVIMVLAIAVFILGGRWLILTIKKKKGSGVKG